jgi:hypothetical protein
MNPSLPTGSDLGVTGALCDKVPCVRVTQIRTGRQIRRASSVLGA